LAFLRTFTALLVAATIWLGLFAAFDEADSPLLNAIAQWLSPLTVLGWLIYLVLCVVCFVLVWRFMGRSSPRARENNGH